MPLSHLWLPYCQMHTAPLPLEAVRTDGVRIHLADGRALIDGTSSWWTACHGYNHPHIRGAIAEQLGRMPHVMLGGLVHRPALELARRLSDLLPGDLSHVFFSESGSVAVEIALKMALQYWINAGQSGRSRFASFRGGYHGDTFAAMSVCDPADGMHRRFAGVLPDPLILDLPRDTAGMIELERILARHARGLAGIIIEPLVQAAGGMRFHEPEVLGRIAEIVQGQDLLLILDEIATGFGRTGSLFACEQAGVVPDIMALSKALTGGSMPLAATVATGRIFESFLNESFERALMHGPTFTGHPLACAAANASLDLFEREPRLEQVARMEAQMKDGLEICRGLSGVRDVRSKGAVGVVQLDRTPDLNALRQRFVDEGVWVRPFRDVVYLMPPLVMEAADLGALIASVYGVVRAWSAAPR